MFEGKYHQVATELESFKMQVTNTFKQLQQKDDDLVRAERLASELQDKLTQKDLDITSQAEDSSRKRREIQKQLDFLGQDVVQRELEVSELKERLRKREDELRELKVNMNSQISGVYD